MRAATDLLLACKDEIVSLNLSPLVLRAGTEFQRAFLFCLERLLHTAQIINPVLMEEIRLNVTNLLHSANTCALKHIPREEKYALAILAYFADFVSG
nr:uncharacterized protein LOC129386819 isoform X2 [Dermacentor andersoni]